MSINKILLTILIVGTSIVALAYGYTYYKFNTKECKFDSAYYIQMAKQEIDRRDAAEKAKEKILEGTSSGTLKLSPTPKLITTGPGFAK